jgi:tripartite-type tricarboxylate transporter receptor subunit TctC
MLLIRFFYVFLIVSCGSASLFASEPEWPLKPVTLLVPLAVGGTVDIVARTLGQKLNVDLGKPFVVDNRGAAGGDDCGGPPSSCSARWLHTSDPPYGAGF